MKPCARCDVLKGLVMNRRVEVQEVTETQDSMGQPVETWATVRVWRADRKDVQAWERFRSDQELAARTSRFTGRWFEANSKMRLLHDGMAWDIVGLAELGRRVALEITATAVRV